VPFVHVWDVNDAGQMPMMYGLGAMTTRRCAFYYKFETLCSVLLTIKVKYYSQGDSTGVSALLCQMLASCIGGPMVKCFSHDPGAIPTLGKPYRICKKKFNYVFTRKEAGLHL